MSSGAVGAATEVEAEKEAEIIVCCANCGIAQVDDIKLEDCDACQSVSYCSDKCRENHREQHEEECQKRKAELRDKELFEQPDSTHLGECPLCFLPLSLDGDRNILSSCCSELVCDGCSCFHHLEHGRKTCPFCREPVVDSDEKHEKRAMKRVKANDPVALREMGTRRYQEGDHDKAVEYWAKSAELGDPTAHYNLGNRYQHGQEVLKNEEKAVYHWEKAAIGGHPYARYHLACTEKDNGNVERAAKHLIIAANLGCEKSMKDLWKYYSAGHITKEELETTLRTHKAAIDATKSSQRDVAEAFYQQLSQQILYRGGRVGQEERR